MAGLSPTPAGIASRAFQNSDDFYRVRGLAIETYPITGRGWNWDFRRWDGSRFHEADPDAYLGTFKDTVRLWETVEGRLVGVVNFDGGDFFFLQLHPDYRDLEEEMIAWAEARRPSGSLSTVVYDYDTPRQRILRNRGYEKQASGDVHRWMRLGERPLPQVLAAEGYRVRSVRGEDLEDCRRMADLLNAAFNRTFHTAGDFHQFARSAPCYNQDLHLIAEAPDGSFAAHAALIYDAANRRGLFEPVCTHPNHRKKRLAQCLMFELLHRLKDLGGVQVTVETGIDMAPANALYDSIGFTEAHKAYEWKKSR